ncbi:hypothetical protein, partial [Neisseria bacilliformis]|uniref:hypothetical protein n=1 Tax=Neisseria bacilliformis TaxID=267212 RepID=UPI003C78E260
MRWKTEGRLKIGFGDFSDGLCVAETACVACATHLTYDPPCLQFDMGGMAKRPSEKPVYRLSDGLFVTRRSG